MEKRIDIFSILKNEGKLSTLYVYSSKETIDDPYEKNRVNTYSNPLPIKAFVQQISFEALRWKYTGLLPSKSIQVIAEKKYITLFKTADKIEYNNESYKCWKNDSKGFAIMERQDYIIVILAKKVD